MFGIRARQLNVLDANVIFVYSAKLCSLANSNVLNTEITKLFM